MERNWNNKEWSRGYEKKHGAFLRDDHDRKNSDEDFKINGKKRDPSSGMAGE